MTPRPDSLAALLNRNCRCTVVDIAALQREIISPTSEDHAIAPASHQHLFSAMPYFVSQRHEDQMREVIAAVEHVVALPAYREAVLAEAPPIARHDPGARGVLFGYDFHLTAEGPRLIEINTNAGGALLNLELLRSQSECCDAASQLTDDSYARRAQSMLDMFLSEWRMRGRSAPLRHVAIVDESPAAQYLYPEFLLFQKLFERGGIEASIVDPREVSFSGDSLRIHGRPIDLVYNRLTDFYFGAEHLAPLRRAYLADAALVTPNPFAHALYAHKRNLTVLSDERRLAEIGADRAVIDVLAASVPRTVSIDRTNADQWWSERKSWFFKPVHGFGSRGVYRGDKLTRRTFADILEGDYIAQRLSPPSERAAADDQEPLKVDIRNYVYDGSVLLLAARTYRGQTTNFRTAGGGFAPLFVVPDQVATRSEIVG